MSFLEGLVWAATAWAAWLAFVFLDAPALLGRAATRLRQQHLPHWARHGHAQPDEPLAPAHGRHRVDGH